MEEKKNTSKIVTIIGLICIFIIIALIGVIIFLVLKLSKNNIIETNIPKTTSSTPNENISDKKEAVKLENTTSFANLKADDSNFDETQQLLIDYFDNNYFSGFGIKDLQQYPQIFTQSKIKTNLVVMKVLKSTDTEYEIVGVQGGSLSMNIFTNEASIYDAGYGEKKLNDIDEQTLVVIRGKQLNKRIIKGDVLTIYGRYTKNEDFNIDGKSYILPIVNAINVVQLSYNDTDNNYRFNLDKIKKVSEYIFGKNIKISKPVINQDYKEESDYYFNPFYKITLDNQSNANFNTFNFYRTYGYVKYNNETKGITKRIFISRDFQHYIVTTYDENLKHVYIEYFDNNLNKIWSREFDNETSIDININGPLDYNSKQFAVIVDNDLYLIDMETGRDIIKPVLVGYKVRVNMTNDGIVLIGNDNKDTIMKVDYNGNILYRTNGNINFNAIEYANTQVIDGKIVVYVSGYGGDEQGLPYEKYIMLNDDGTIYSETETMVGEL